MQVAIPEKFNMEVDIVSKKIRFLVAVVFVVTALIVYFIGCKQLSDDLDWFIGQVDHVSQELGLNQLVARAGKCLSLPIMMRSGDVEAIPQALPVLPDPSAEAENTDEERVETPVPLPASVDEVSELELETEPATEVTPTSPDQAPTVTSEVPASPDNVTAQHEASVDQPVSTSLSTQKVLITDLPTRKRTKKAPPLPAYFIVIDDHTQLDEYFIAKPHDTGWELTIKPEIPANYFFAFSSLFVVTVDGKDAGSMPIIGKNTHGKIFARPETPAMSINTPLP